MECVSVPKQFLDEIAKQMADLRAQLAAANKTIDELSKKKKTKKATKEVAETPAQSGYVPLLSEEELAKKAKKVAAAAHARACKAAKKAEKEASAASSEESN
jgi:ATPase subunit of ABC transporter with duplicated ATPase domains